MKLPPDRSKFWDLLGIVVVGVLLLLFFNLMYDNPMELKKDLPTIGAVLSGLGVVGMVKRYFGGSE